MEVAVSRCDTDEAADIAEQILVLRQAKATREPLSLAVLYRNHLHRERVIEELAAREIPFIVKAMDILDAAAVRDILAVAGAVAQEGDADSLFRICAIPHFSLDAQELRTQLVAAGGKIPFKTVLANLESGRRVLAEIEDARASVARQKLGTSAALVYLIDLFELPVDDMAVKALLRFAAEWEKKPYFESHSLQVFLEYLKLFIEGGGMVPLLTEDQLVEAAESNPDAVQLMTVHGAKGLEFSHVWLLRVVSNSFPNSLS